VDEQDGERGGRLAFDPRNVTNRSVQVGMPLLVVPQRSKHFDER
jgi:hypothetical protein